MKLTSILGTALFIPAVCFFTSCQKEAVSPSNASVIASQKMVVDKPAPQEHQLKGRFTAGYYSFIPDMAAGYVAPNPAPAWYPGVSTEGQLNLLGRCQAFVNMYAAMGPSGLQGVAAPVNLVFASQLSKVGITVPDNVGIIYFDEQGNSIWGRAKGIFALTPVSPTMVTFRGDADIIGGTGKFSDATGSFVFSGYLNPQDTKDVAWELTEGTITY